MLMYSLHPFVRVCLPQNCGSSPLTLPKRINCPLLFYAILFCSGSYSNDRITITRDSYIRWGIFACQPACLPLSLSQFVILSLSYSLVFSFPFLFYPTYSFCHSFSHCMVDDKQYNSCEEQKGPSVWKRKSLTWNHGDNCFQHWWTNNRSCLLLYILVFLQSQNKMMPNSLHWPHSSSKQPLRLQYCMYVESEFQHASFV